MARSLEKITSFQNPRIKLVGKLRDKRERARQNLFVIDALRDLQRALTCHYDIDHLFYCPALDSSGGALASLPDVVAYEISRDLMEKISYRDNPSPIVAVMRQKAPLTPDDFQQAKPERVLGLVNLQKPGNIGALLRTADAAGFQAALLVDTALDIYNPNIIRSSTGACFLDNIYNFDSTHALTLLRDGGYTTVAAAVDGEGNLYKADLRQPVAIILGTEDTGLDAVWQTACAMRVQIPMAGRLSDSLNVSVAGAVMMYETLRQNSPTLG